MADMEELAKVLAAMDKKKVKSVRFSDEQLIQWILGHARLSDPGTLWASCQQWQVASSA